LLWVLLFQINVIEKLLFIYNKALEYGASSLEIYETIGVAIYMGGAQSVIYGCEAVEALNQFIVLENNEQ